MAAFNVIFVCDTCLEELVIGQAQFYPQGVSQMIKDSEAQGWFIPELVRFSEKKQRYYATPASDIKCYCPKHSSMEMWIEKE